MIKFDIVRDEKDKEKEVSELPLEKNKTLYTLLCVCVCVCVCVLWSGSRPAAFQPEAALSSVLLLM